MFNAPKCSQSLAWTLWGTISTDINEHIFDTIDGVEKTANGGLGDAARAEPARIQVHFLGKPDDCSCMVYFTIYMTH
jgi:hypothetical protein